MVMAKKKQDKNAKGVKTEAKIAIEVSEQRFALLLEAMSQRCKKIRRTE